MYQLWGWGRENMGIRAARNRGRSEVGEGMLHGRKEEVDEGRFDD